MGSTGEARGELQGSRTGSFVGKLTSVLLYSLEFPPDVERSFLEDNRKFGDPLPERMQNKPNLHAGLALYFNAWFELDLERNRDTGERIRRSEIYAYARDFELNARQADDLWFYIRRMDSAFFEWYAKRKKRTNSKPEMPTIPKGRRNGRRS